MKPKDMTDEQLRIKVAELLGWKEIGKWSSDTGRAKMWPGHGMLYGDRPQALCCNDRAIIPFYEKDLNACHEIERAVLTDVTLQAEYIMALRGASWDRNYTKADGWACFATARQRCEAFVEVMSK